MCLLISKDLYSFFVFGAVSLGLKKTRTTPFQLRILLFLVGLSPYSKKIFVFEYLGIKVCKFVHLGRDPVAILVCFGALKL